MTTVTHTESSTGPNGRVTLALLALLSVVFVLIAWRYAATWRVVADARDEATDSTSRFCCSASARVFAAIPRPWGTLAAYCARLVALTLAAFACASLIGVCGNMAGGFYTTWSSVGQTIVDSLH